MEYTPKYPQPFTLEKAVALDPEVASDEIARLQNSIAHLKRTQDELKDYMEDPEVRQAVEENRTTIASQDERIFILKLALTHHGISHTSPSLPAGTSSTLHENDPTARNSDPHSIPRESASENDGVYL